MIGPCRGVRRGPITAWQTCSSGRSNAAPSTRCGLATRPLSTITAAGRASNPCRPGNAVSCNELRPDLLEPTRAALESTSRPYAIEQPPGRASKRMRVDVTLCGEMFGLSVIRHRNFELGGWTTTPPVHRPHRGRVAGLRHGQWYEGPYFAVYGDGGGKGTVAQWQHAMGITWTGVRKEIAEAIPPAYGRWLAERFLAHVNAGRVPA